MEKAVRNVHGKGIQKFKFISHALNGTGGFSPHVSYDSLGRPIDTTLSYLVRYSRESDEKYARRCDVAFYTAPLAQAVARFDGYLSSKKVVRTLPHELYEVMAKDIDGKGNSLEVFMSSLTRNAKARGSMLLLVDMPKQMTETQGQQIEQRVAPFWTAIFPENIVEFEISDNGKFEYVKFSGTYVHESGEHQSCEWYFDEEIWSALDGEKLIDGAEHGLAECPVLIFTEHGDFPCFGPFSHIADLSRRLYNLESELDEILRAQTFSLLTLQAPENSTTQEKLEAARIAGETIGASNLMVHSGQQPAFIAPPDGPARIYLDRIQAVKNQIEDMALSVDTINQQESGFAMQMRFQAINAELATFSMSLEDLERRAWDMSAKWLMLSVVPEIEYPRDFNMADVQTELEIYQTMQAAGMPDPVLLQQQRKIVATQFGGLDQDAFSELEDSFAEQVQEQYEPVEPVEIVDGNSDLRSAVVRYLNNG